MSRGDGFEFEVNGRKLLVGYHPMRKSPCLTLVTNNVHQTVAYFRNEGDAVDFIEHVTGTKVEFKEE